MNLNRLAFVVMIARTDDNIHFPLISYLDMQKLVDASSIPIGQIRKAYLACPKNAQIGGAFEVWITDLVRVLDGVFSNLTSMNIYSRKRIQWK